MFGRERLLRSHLRQRFVVTMKTGMAFEGIILDVDSRIIILADTQAIDPRTPQEPRPVDGHLFLERADVEYMQLTQTPPLLQGVVSR